MSHVARLATGESERFLSAFESQVLGVSWLRDLATASGRCAGEVAQHLFRFGVPVALHARGGLQRRIFS
eukprot:8591814-Alexandrium_andersonii.AAC.1